MGIDESSASVYGLGIFEEFLFVGYLDDLPEVHHGDSIRDVPNNGEVVTDE